MALQHESELDEELNRGCEVVNHDADVLHPLDTHLTLLQGLQLGSGGGNALTRHAIAAVLSAAHPDVDYPFSVSDIVSMVNAAYASGDATQIESLKNTLDRFNNLRCGLSQNA